MDGQWTCVPGDRGETDLAEEEGTVLSQLGVETATKNHGGVVEIENQAIRIM